MKLFTSFIVEKLRIDKNTKIVKGNTFSKSDFIHTRSGHTYMGAINQNTHIDEWAETVDDALAMINASSEHDKFFIIYPMEKNGHWSWTNNKELFKSSDKKYILVDDNYHPIDTYTENIIETIYKKGAIIVKSKV